MKNPSTPTNAVSLCAFHFKQYTILIFAVLFYLFLSPADAQTYKSSSSSFAVSGDNTLTINKPAGMSVNDVMIAAIDVRPFGAGITVPSGWQVIIKTDSKPRPGWGENSQVLYWKAVTASEPANYTWSFSTTGGSAGGILCFSNVNMFDPVDQVAGQGNAASLTQYTPAITTTTANSTVISALGFGSSSKWNTPSGWNQVVDVSSKNTDQYGVSICMNYLTKATAGSVSVSTSANNDPEVGVGQILSLNAAPVATTISYPSAACISSGTVAVARTGTSGGTYSASPAGLAINAASGLVTPSSSTPGTYTITYTFAGGYTTTDNITIDAASVAGTIAGSTSVCWGINSGTLTLSGQTGNVIRWESSVDGTTWNTIANTTTSLTYSILTQTTQYRAVVQNGTCSATNAAAATVTVTPPSVGGTVSSSTTVCSGSNGGSLTLSGQTGNVTHWESSVNGTTWTTIANTTTSITYTNLTQTTQYRAVVQSGTCSAANAAAATITVSPPSVGGTVASSTTVCSGSNSGTLTLSGQTGNVIRWESSLNGTTWTAIANTTTSLTYTNLTQTIQYRAVVQSGVCAAANAAAATVTVNAASIGGTVSSSASVCTGTNSGALSLTGQTGNVTRWESSVNGTTWTAIANTTTSLTYTNLTQTTQYRAVVQSGVCTAANAAASTITVTPAAVGGSVSGSATVCTGTNSGSLTLTGQTGSVSGWEYSLNGTTWTAIANTTTSLTYTNLTQTTQYRAVVQSGVCAAANAAAATVTVNAVSVGGSVGGSASVCTGTNSGTLSLTGQTGSVLRWESSLNGTTWTTIVNTTASLTYTNLTQTTQYRAVVQSGVCTAANAAAATITVTPAAVGGSVSGSATVCSGSNTGTLTLTGQTGSVSGWEYSLNGTTWTAIANTTTSLTYTNLTQTTQYRAIVQNGVCAAANAAAAITVTPPAVGGSVNSSTSVCAGINSGTLNLTGQTGSVIRWESSINGTTWTVIVNTTTSLTYTNLTQTTQYRAVVQSGVCSTANAAAATITVNAVSIGGSVGGGASVCAGANSGTLSLTGQTGNIVRWESSVNGTTWTAIANTTASLTYTNLTQTTQYRSVIQSGACSAAYAAAATITVNTAPGATISYTGSPYCSSSGTATVTRIGTSGGSYSSSAGLVINPATGDVTLASSTAGTYTVSYTVTNLCGTYTATTSITITMQPSVTGNYPGNPYCTNFGIAYPVGSSTGASGTISSTPGLSINSSTGVVDLAASLPGNYTVTYTVPASGGCTLYAATYSLVIIGSPNASISYSGSPYCPNAGTVAVTRTGTAGGVYSSTAGLSINAATGDVNINTSTAGTYTVTYNIAAAGSCAAFQTTTSLIINTPGSWTGAVNTLWQLGANWQCNQIPSNSTNVIIPAGVPNYPVINSTITGMSNNLTIQPGATVTVNNGTLQIKGTVTAAGAYITATSGKVEFNGTAAQTVPASLFFTNTIKDIVITNPADVTLAGPVRVTGTVDFGSVDSSTLYSNGYLTLASTASNTAALLDVTNGGVNKGNLVAGDVVVERYMQGKRAYRFLTAPINSTTTIKANWMEGVSNTSPWVNNNPFPNYGTHITGASPTVNYFDATQTNNPSLYKFNVATQGWTAAANTSGFFSAGTGFRIIVRGSRSVDLNNNDAVSSATTLRAKGTLITGPVTFTKAGGAGTAGMPALSGVAGAYSFIANPYASSVDWGSIITNNFTDLSPTMYIFDPTVRGSSNRGAYVSYNGQLNVKNILTSLVNNDLQSGQAIFVQTTGPNPSLTFRETYKSANFLPLFRTANEVPHMNIELLLPDQVNSTGSADGTAVYFSNDYSNLVSDEDSYKFTNQDENIAVVSNGSQLSLEGRKPVAGADSVVLKIWQLTLKSYTLRITLDKFANNTEAYLEDRFLNTATPLANGETLVPFSITADAASGAANRFKIVFETLATLPVRLTGIKAYEKNKGVQVDWVAESEISMDLYEIEKSADAQNFKTIASVKAKNNPGVSTAYNGFDISPFTGENYYRIKSIDKSGEVKESEVVRVNVAGGRNTISVTNNPVSGNAVNVLFNNAEKGTYAVSLINAAGDKVYAGKIFYAGGTVYNQIGIKPYLPGGIYQLQFINGNSVTNVQVLIQQ